MKNLAIIALFVAFSACSPAPESQMPSTSAANSPTPAAVAEVVKKEITTNECRICDFDYAGYKGDFKKEEIEGLLLALNDEYHALAIYEKVNEKFGDPRPFVNMERAEARRAERLKQIFKLYNVPVPENVWPGNAPEFKTVAETFRAGVEGEIINRDLYKQLFETTKREDILTVYRALQSASEENHLPAFERCGRGSGKKRGNF